MENQYPLNQFAPTYFQGVQQPPGIKPRPYTYLYSPPTGALTANQLIVGASVAIETDADFELWGLYLTQITGAFQMRITDAQGYQLSSGMVNSGALSVFSFDPTLISPSHLFPAGSKISIDIQDLSALLNPLQIAFVGRKLFRAQ